MIFNLFKSKPTLKELIPKEFVDIHSHILPGLDDGAKNINESIELITGMKKMGYSKIICTPHTYPGLYSNTSELIENSKKKLLESSELNVSISCASEYMIDTYLIEKAKNKDILTLRKNFVLIETGFLFQNKNIYNIIFEIILNGYRPILAHPERYLYFEDNFKEFWKLKKCGCKFQINLLSLINYYKNSKIINLSEKLLKNGLIDYVGSDVHNINHKMP